MKTFCMASFAFVVCCMFPFAVYGQGEYLKIDFILEQHKKSRDLVQSAFCDISTCEIDKNGSKIDIRKGQFWASPKELKAVVDENNGTYTYVWKDSIRTGFLKKNNKGPGSQDSASRTSFSSRHIHPLDPWVRGLLVLIPPEEMEGFPLEKLVENCSTPPTIKMENIDKTDLIVIGLVFNESKDKKRNSKWKLDVCIDPKTKFLIRKCIYLRLDDNFERTEEVVSFNELKTGIYFPEKTRTIAKLNGVNKSLHEGNIKNAVLNPIFEDDFFNINFEEGMLFFDNLKKTYFRVNEMGDPITDARSQGKVPPLPEGNVVPVSATKKEPGSWLNLVFPISGAILGITLIVSVARRFKARKNLNHD